MPVTPTYPGVYIEELESGVRTITGVSTSVTAFVGRALRGPEHEPTIVNSYGDFERIYGGLWVHSTMSYAVQDFFTNGGTQAIIVRINHDGTPATINVPTGFVFQASSPGDWGNRLRISVEHVVDEDHPGSTDLYSLIIRDTGSRREERLLRISKGAEPSRSLENIIEQSDLVTVVASPGNTRPDKHTAIPPGIDPFSDDPLVAGTHYEASNNDGTDGGVLDDDDFAGAGTEANKEGIYGLLRLENTIFNLLCLPPITNDTDLASGTWTAAGRLCRDKRAILLVDCPHDWDSIADASAGVTTVRGWLGDSAANGALYFPRLRKRDPKQSDRLTTFAPCGAVAGVIARTDGKRGVWKAPAGIEATIAGVTQLSVTMTDPENGQLNPLGINCIRRFPVAGRVIWGARTLRGADQLADQWKYLPVRRTALYIEESLYKGTQWVVFEPNDEPLWASIRLSVGAFMHNLFKQHAFQGTKPSEAYFVKCDKDTTTQYDIDRGIVNILVGFAPLKPAEFVIIQISQIAGQVQA